MNKFWLSILSFVCLVELGGIGAAEATRVDFASQPEGAVVLIDGEVRGKTPLALYDVAPGLHHVKYRLAGFVDGDEFVQVSAGTRTQNAVELEPLKGLLLLTSEPAGCAITIDGISNGETPRLVTHLNAKDTYKVTLDKPGYRSANFEVGFDGRRPLRRFEKMVLDSGILDIVTEPAGAEVTVHGLVRGVTPLRVVGVQKGSVEVCLRLAGYREETRLLTVNAGDEQFLRVTLQSLPGALSLVSLPAGARFYVDGAYVGKSPVTLSRVEAGDRQVRAELEGYGTLERILKVENGASVNEEFRLASVMGRLEVRSSPAGAQVLLDGRLVGVTPSAGESAEWSDSLAIENVQAGEHIVTLRLDGYQEDVRHPKVVSCETSQVKTRLNRLFSPDIEIVTSTGTYRGRLVKQNATYVTVEIQLGIDRDFPRSEIRECRFLKK